MQDPEAPTQSIIVSSNETELAETELYYGFDGELLYKTPEELSLGSFLGMGMLLAMVKPTALCVRRPGKESQDYMLPLTAVQFEMLVMPGSRVICVVNVVQHACRQAFIQREIEKVRASYYRKSRRHRTVAADTEQPSDDKRGNDTFLGSALTLVTSSVPSAVSSFLSQDLRVLISLGCCFIAILSIFITNSSSSSLAPHPHIK